MTLCNNIIVPLDGSKLSAQALPAARLMANATRAPITLVRSFDRVPDWHVDADHGRFSAAMSAGEHDRTVADLACIRRRMEHWGVETPILLEAHEDPAHEAIIRMANRDPSAMVVMSTHGRGGFSRMLTGSVTAKVVNAVRNPTLIVRCNKTDCPVVPQFFENIIVPLDGSGFAEHALDYAGELATTFGTRITLFRSTPGADYFRTHSDWGHYGGAGFGFNEPENMARDLAHSSEDYLWKKADALRARFPLFDVEVVNSRENPEHGIVNLANRLDNGLVVMATRGRRAVGRALFGSVGDHVVRHSTTPTLLVRGPLHAREGAFGGHQHDLHRELAAV
ncbi:MAG: universal stress protein [Chloroflexi bacterium]|nr:universal stress protein [Chloroflexota bacterium]